MEIVISCGLCLFEEEAAVWNMHEVWRRVELHDAQCSPVRFQGPDRRGEMRAAAIDSVRIIQPIPIGV